MPEPPAAVPEPTPTTVPEPATVPELIEIPQGIEPPNVPENVVPWSVEGSQWW
jgi:hypothetical protein